MQPVINMNPIRAVPPGAVGIPQVPGGILVRAPHAPRMIAGGTAAGFFSGLGTGLSLNRNMGFTYTLPEEFVVVSALTAAGAGLGYAGAKIIQHMRAKKREQLYRDRRPGDVQLDVVVDMNNQPVILPVMGANGEVVGVPVRGAMKKGGNVKKTGLYQLHKGEKVIPAEKVKQDKKVKQVKKVKQDKKKKC